MQSVQPSCSHRLPSLRIPTASLHCRQLKMGTRVHTVSVVKPLGIQKLLSGNRWC